MAGLAPPFTHVVTSSGSTSGEYTRPSRPLKRSASAVSLPSPPEDMETGPTRPPYIDLSSGGPHYSDEDDLDLLDAQSDGEYDAALIVNKYQSGSAEHDEVDELDSDVDLLEDDHVAGERPRRLLGANHASTSNPFLAPDSTAAKRDRQARVDAATASARPDHPQASPTHVARGAAARRRRKHDDVEKIHVTPKLGHDSLSAKGTVRHPPQAMGADDLANPFIDRPQDPTDERGEKRGRWRKGQAARPDRVTYVFRGKRITYDVPLSALLAPEDPSESPFAEPSPRLLFPPKSADPVTPPSQLRFGAASAAGTGSFLEALRASSTTKPGHGQGLGLPPTPVTQKRTGRQDARDCEEEVPEQRLVYKRMRMDSSGGTKTLVAPAPELQR